MNSRTKDNEIKDILDYDIKQFTFPRSVFNNNKKTFVSDNITRLPPHSRILDVGCGAGLVTNHLRDEYDLYGIDKNPRAIDYCIKTYNNSKYLVADLENRLPFKNDFFGGIVMTEVLDHLEYPDKTIKELKRIMAKKGILIITVMNYGSIKWKVLEQVWYRLFGGNCQPYKKDIHPTRFTVESLTSLLKNNFEKVEVKTINMCLEMGGVCFK